MERYGGALGLVQGGGGVWGAGAGMHGWGDYIWQDLTACCEWGF
jgi:hypothetical protein